MDYKRLSAVLGVIAALGAAWFGASQLGLDLPRPAWSTELTRINNQIVGLDVRTLQMIVDSIQRQVWHLERNMKNNNGGTDSDRFLLKQLAAQLRTAQAQLKAVRGF
jgi:hypothetical protein